MANVDIDTEVLKVALTDISGALESIELSVRSGARFRASDLKTMLDAVNSLLRALESKT